MVGSFWGETTAIYILYDLYNGIYYWLFISFCQFSRFGIVLFFQKLFLASKAVKHKERSAVTVDGFIV
jgi:hypothetical protein